MDILVLGMVMFLLCTVASRFVSERALRTLPSDQKLALIDGFADMRTYGLMWAAGLFVVMFLLPKAFPEDPRIGLYIGMALVAIFIAVRLVMTQRRIKAMDLEPAYRQQVVVAQLI